MLQHPNVNLAAFIQSLGNPAKPFLFKVYFNYGAGLTMGMRVVTAQIPTISVSDIEVFYHGQKVTYPGAIDNDKTWTTTIIEGEDFASYKYLYAWWTAVQSGIPRASYVGAVTVVPVMQALANLPTSPVPAPSWTMIGAYPKNIDDLELDRSNNTESWKWNVTFNFTDLVIVP